MVMSFKLYFTKDPTVSSTAAATVRQMVSVLFDRVVTEDSKDKGKSEYNPGKMELNSIIAFH